MTVVGTAVLLGLLVAVLVKWRIVQPVAAIVCILFGLVLGATPIGGEVNTTLTAVGTWLSAQVGQL